MAGKIQASSEHQGTDGGLRESLWSLCYFTVKDWDRCL